MNRFELDYNSLNLKERRKKLRNNMTKAEVILWSYIRKRQVNGVKFRRQFSIKNYVIDFFAPEIKLSIEVDGATHITEEEIKYDNERQKFLENLGISFLRFTNWEIYDSLEIVLDAIKTKIKELKN